MITMWYSWKLWTAVCVIWQTTISEVNNELSCLTSVSWKLQRKLVLLGLNLLGIVLSNSIKKSIGSETWYGVCFEMIWAQWPSLHYCPPELLHLHRQHPGRHPVLHPVHPNDAARGFLKRWTPTWSIRGDGAIVKLIISGQVSSNIIYQTCNIDLSGRTTPRTSAWTSSDDSGSSTASLSLACWAGDPRASRVRWTCPNCGSQSQDFYLSYRTCRLLLLLISIYQVQRIPVKQDTWFLLCLVDKVVKSYQ